MASKTFKANKSEPSCKLRGDMNRAKARIARRDSHFQKKASGNSLTQRSEGNRKVATITGRFVSSRSESSADKLLLDAWEKTYENRHKRKG